MYGEHPGLSTSTGGLTMDNLNWLFDFCELLNMGQDKQNGDLDISNTLNDHDAGIENEETNPQKYVSSMYAKTNNVLLKMFLCWVIVSVL